VEIATNISGLNTKIRNCVLIAGRKEMMLLIDMTIWWKKIKD
jgi:hypothetical protein